MEKEIQVLETVARYTNTIKVDEATYRKMMRWAEHEVSKFNTPLYGHNDIKPTLRGCMGEYAVRELYKKGGIKAFQNLHKDEPDISIPSLERNEEVKSWAAGFIYDEWGNTIRPAQLKKYIAKKRARVWFCEVCLDTRTVIVWGWETPQYIKDNWPVVMTTGKYGALNHEGKVLRRVNEVLPMCETIDDDGSWF